MKTKFSMWLRNELKSSKRWTDQSIWDLSPWIFPKHWCTISTTVISSKSIQIRHCNLLIEILARIKFNTSMPISNCSIFLCKGKKSQFYNDENKKVMVKMKGEFNGEIIEEFVSLRLKIYSLKTKKKEKYRRHSIMKSRHKKWRFRW